MSSQGPYSMGRYYTVGNDCYEDNVAVKCFLVLPATSFASATNFAFMCKQEKNFKQQQ
jgi:hypothetical protein